MRLAYADPPYPGKAHLYPENTEVDHAELIARLRTYDGWALSTDERSLRFILGLCPDGVRVLSWGRKNVPPLLPNPIASWEPVILWPARKSPAQLPLFVVPDRRPSGSAWINRLRRYNTSLPGLEPDRANVPERSHKKGQAA